ncbi:hypothetical protein chiPu_0028426, partial [Chiloscyllium punctatum]|nr:hypothetical protein [Chiloscyllium punctatum]
MADAACDADRRRLVRVRPLSVARVDQLARVLGGATDRDRPLDADGAECAAAGGHGAGDREEPLSVRQFQPLRHDLAWRLEDAVDRPQRTRAAVLRKRKSRAVEQLGDVARRIDADQEERDLFQARPLQGRDAMRRLLEAGAELTRQCLEVVATGFDRFREHGVGHDERGCRVGAERAAGQQFGALAGELAVL